MSVISSLVKDKYGAVWSVANACPTIADNTVETVSAINTGIYSQAVNSSLANTQYYIRPFVNNSEGITYGETSTVTTLPITPPSIGTDPTGATFSAGDNTT